MWAAGIFFRTRTLDPAARRLLIMRGQYQDALRVNQRVPPEASVWFVSPHTPTDIGYFLFPRRLRWGSPSVSERDAVRRRHPYDWVLTNHSSNPQFDSLELFAPIVQKGS